MQVKMRVGAVKWKILVQRNGRGLKAEMTSKTGERLGTEWDFRWGWTLPIGQVLDQANGIVNGYGWDAPFSRKTVPKYPRTATTWLSDSGGSNSGEDEDLEIGGEEVKMKI
jgi:hypothetical protein